MPKFDIKYSELLDTYCQDDRTDGIFGYRKLSDRRFWAAWSSVHFHEGDIIEGVIDDYGQIVEVFANPGGCHSKEVLCEYHS